MPINPEPLTLEWVAVGAGAYGLVRAGRVVALVYWEGADVAELDGGDPVVTEPGFSWVPVDDPWEHFYLFETPAPAEHDWVRARELAARAYFEWTGSGVGYAKAVTAELRREAAEFLDASRWWQQEQVRDEMLSRRWHSPLDEHARQRDRD